MFLNQIFLISKSDMQVKIQVHWPNAGDLEYGGNHYNCHEKWSDSSPNL